ncbi:MAG: WD40 repeat domain-containing protein [Kiritimatiellia bacterium]
MGAGGFIQGDTRYTGQCGRWSLADTVSHPNLGIGVEEYLVALCNNNMSFYTAPDFRRRTPPGDPIYSGTYPPYAKAVFFNDGRMAVPKSGVYLGDAPGVRFWKQGTANWDNNPALAPIQQIGIGFNVNSVAVSPDGSLMAVALSRTPYVRVYDMSSYIGSDMDPKCYSSPTALSWSADNRYLLATFGGVPYVKILDISTRLWFSAPTSGSAAPYDGAFSPSGDAIAIGHGTSLGIYDWNTLKNARTTTYPTLSNLGSASLYGLGWHPDGTYVAVGLSYGSPNPFRIVSGSWTGTGVVMVPPQPVSITTACYGATFSPSGKWLAFSTVGQGIHIYKWGGGVATYWGTVKDLPDSATVYKLSWWNSKLRKAS